MPCSYRLSVKAIIKDDDDRVLLIREKDGCWELPGGGLEHGEGIHEALRREVAEEIGCNAKEISDQPVAFWTIRKDVGAKDLKWFAFVAYEVKITGEFCPDLHRNEEAEEAAYYFPAEAAALKLHDNAKPYFIG